MAEQKKRSLIDELAERVGEALDQLDRLFQPQREPAHAPVPIPVRNNDHRLPRRRRR